MKKHNNDYRGSGKEVWQELERVIAQGHSRHKVFTDWLDMMLNAHLSLTDNIKRHGVAVLEKVKSNSLDGVYEERYLKIVRTYASDKPQGQRPVDYFAKATALLQLEIQETGRDVLGNIYEGCITFGEHGQFFTPEHVADMVSAITGKVEGSVLDPACGSGRMLLCAHRQNPSAILYGTDLDERCAKMCALNMVMFGCNAVIFWGDSLAMKNYCQWEISSNGLITEHEVKEQLREFGQGELPLAA